jgi:phospholipid transport system transporter-binding protein
MAMLVLPSELTHTQANTCLSMLREAARSTKADRVLVDASALVRFDSSALAVLLESRRDALHDGKGFAVVGLPARLHELAGLYGVAELLSETPEPAVAAPG